MRFNNLNNIPNSLSLFCYRIYCLRVSEHTALDCAFLELVPTLYVNIETEVTLHAACDTTEPGSQPRKRPPSASTLNCAGPAEIIIKVTTDFAMR